MNSISFASLKQLCGWFEVVEYNDEEGMLAKERGASARLQTLCVLGKVTFDSIITQATILKVTTPLELVGLTNLTVLQELDLNGTIETIRSSTA